jgi:hypothetical protein
MDKSYEVTPEDCNEAITQEIYIQAGFKTSLCVLLLNTGFEAVGRYAPIDIQDINISIGKEKSRAAAMVEVVKHLESKPVEKSCRRESKKKRGEIPKQYYCRTKT